MDFTRIDELKTKLKSLRPLNETEVKRLRDEFIVENTYHSNAIEGNTLTLRETALILQEGITIAEKPVRDHLEAIGHKDAFEYIIDIAKENSPLTESVIKDIHSLVLMNDAMNRGKYRQIPVSIFGAEHTPPQPYLVSVQMENLLARYEEIKGKVHVIEAISQFHLDFERIHPFVDGNATQRHQLKTAEQQQTTIYQTFKAFTNSHWKIEMPFLCPKSRRELFTA